MWIIVWLFAAISILIFVKFFLIPFIKRRRALRQAAGLLRKVAKKHAGEEIGNELNEIAEGIDNIRRKISITGNEPE